MSLATAGLWVTSLWLVIYAAKYISRRPKFLLPISHHRRPSIEFTVKHLTLRLKTEALNDFHDELSARLSQNGFRILRRVLLRIYDLGCVVGIIGMALGFCLLVLTALSLSLEILQAGRDGALDPNTITKRGLGYVGDATLTTPSSANALRINPIIPGLTVPFSHLPLILVALGLSQIFHEAGHAITAAIHRIPMLSCGVALTVIFPSAFVTLSAVRLEKLSPRDRLQIVSAGCFHNLVLLCLLFSAAWSGTSSLFTRILFQDVSGLGRVVVDVDYDSPLAVHLPVGTLVTKIDDYPMASVSSNDPWDNYLLSPSSDPLQGWCVNSTLLGKSKAQACTNSSPHSCFVSKGGEMAEYELDPVPIFTENLVRCHSSVECSSSSSCVVPRRDQQLVRISISSGGNTADMIVWKGPKEEIWEQVQVGTLRPRVPLVSSKLPKLAAAFFEYMKIANLSLYVVNMLPITALDGYQLLVALLQLLYGEASGGLESIDLEAVTNTPRLSQEGRTQRSCRTLLKFSAFFLVALCGFLGVVSWAQK